MSYEWRHRIVQLEDGLYLASNGSHTRDRKSARVFTSYQSADASLRVHEYTTNKRWPRALILEVERF